MNVGKSIHEIRKQKGLSQGDLCAAIGMSQTNLSQVENNKRRLSEKNLANLCKALDTPIAILYIHSIELRDFPINRRKQYQLLLPAIKSLLEQLIY